MTTAAARESLRELCSDYFHGLIPADAYRRRRGVLLDGVVLGSQAVAQDDEERTQPRPSVTVAEQPAVASGGPQGGAGRRNVLYAGAAAVVVLVALAIWWLPNRESTPSGATSAKEPTASAPAVSIAAGSDESPATAFVVRFVQDNTWTEDALSAFLFEWDQLTDSQQAALRQSDPFRSLIGKLKSRILELHALADASNKASIDRFRLVVSFARELDVDPGVSDVELSSRGIATRSETPSEPTGVASQPADGAVAAPAVNKPVADKVDAAAAVTKVEPAPTTPKRVAAATPPKGDTSARPTATAPSAVPAAAAQAAPTAPVSRRPCRKEVVAVTPLPPPDRRSCFDMIDASRGPLMIVLPAGTFSMGSSDDKISSPVHPVKIAEPFALSVYEITVGEFRRFCVDKARQCGSLSTRDDDPVVGVTWQDATEYSAWLSAKTGVIYRLPSEAEWEYAARAGTTTRYPFGDDINQAQAVFAVAGVTGPMERSKSVVPNDFGLKHMVGNVREWVADIWAPSYADAPADGHARSGDGTQRVTRGGAYSDSKKDVTSAARLPEDAGVGNAQTGFRVLREL